MRQRLVGVLGAFRETQSGVDDDRVEPHACGGLMPHTSPSGSQTWPPEGMVQKPDGGLVPATIWHFTRPSPGRPLPVAPQQSASL